MRTGFPLLCCECSTPILIIGISFIQILSNKVKATTFLSTHAFIKAITPKLGRFLGPKGLMPSERRGTVTDDIGSYIRKLSGTNEWKADKDGIVRMSLGKVR